MAGFIGRIHRGGSAVDDHAVRNRSVWDGLQIDTQGVTQVGITSTAVMGVTEALAPIGAAFEIGPRLIALVFCAIAASLGQYEGTLWRRAASYVVVVAFLFTAAFGANRAASEIKHELVVTKAEAAEIAGAERVFQDDRGTRKPFDPW